MQHTPWSAKTNAPASSWNSPVYSSLTTAAVKPTLLDALPFV